MKEEKMEKKEQYYSQAGINAAALETSVSFDPQLPLGAAAGTALFTESDSLIPPGIRLLGGNRIRLNFYAPDANRVSALIQGEECSLERDGPLWSAEVEIKNGGFCPVLFSLDGAEVLNPMAPVGFGASRPINYIDVPQPGNDFYHVKDVPHGSVVQEYYYSGAANSYKSCLVYTPPGYMKDTEQVYPVLYLQHGHGENERCWVHQGKANFILDNLIAAGNCVPFIVVMNNGMVQSACDGLRVLDTKKIEQLLIEDCIPFIEKTYRVKTDKWNRGMAGLSMGSLQTSLVTLRHPELFAYAGVFSGFVASFGVMQSDNSHLKELEDAETFRSHYKLFFRANGDRDFVARERFDADSALFEEKGLSPRDCPAHVVKIYSGEHEWNVWRMCLRDFAGCLFR